MRDDLDEPVRRALQEARLDLALEFRRAADGTKSGAVVIRDADGRPVAEVPVDSPEEMNVTLARLVLLGFRNSAPAPRLDPPGPQAPTPSRQVEASVLVAGVDGYRKGWIAVSLDPSGDVEVSTHVTFAEVLSLRARVIAVDIPIDPAGLGARPADAAARAFVGSSRASSVFPTPPRAALEARTFGEASEIARTITGKGITQQAFALGKKILEVHALAEVDERVIEMHPEVSFCEQLGRARPRVEALAGRTGAAARDPGRRRNQAARRGPRSTRGGSARCRGRRLDGGPLLGWQGAAGPGRAHRPARHDLALTDT